MSLTIILRSLSSVVVLSGAGMIAMGLGVVDVDNGMLAVAAQVIGPNLVPVRPFLIFLGSSKVLGALGLWGYGFFPQKMAFAACAIPPACAIYGHAKLGEMQQAGAAGVYLAMVSALYFLESRAKKSAKKE
eukprot:CAMPEP_0119026764 /NCGR_PEP_ID=MMETSP1176-20130426/36007_1 /TAXON_ID=265551 /ORGANISM="Synedropsis recta cf, Strain CCMP1620" /LENGTH=130 /DNA_ID=CAMNT_0006982545 /DNA_START=19 /DNA_END=411 /DNA_ORIENTATION=+